MAGNPINVVYPKKMPTPPQYRIIYMPAGCAAPQAVPAGSTATTDDIIICIKHAALNDNVAAI